jgi:aconitate hydratase 2/2-methylisocitrate dehydratase
MLDTYRLHAARRAALDLPPLPLDAEGTAALIELLQAPPAGQEALLLELLSERVPAGVDPAAKLKSRFLGAIADGAASSPVVDDSTAVRLLGTMRGGYNVAELLRLLDHETLAGQAARELAHTLLVAEAFEEIAAKARGGHLKARSVLESWADGDWFTGRPAPPDELEATVFRVPGETTTDDLSPAPDAWSRPDIPLHAQSMLKGPRPGRPDALARIAELQRAGLPLAFVGDVVGTGSSRKSATNSLLWHIGRDLPQLPNKRGGGLVLAGRIAPIFFDTLRDAGCLPIECDVSGLRDGERITLHLREGRIAGARGETRTTFELRPPTLLDELRAGGRIPLIVGRALTARARAELGLGPSAIFPAPPEADRTAGGFSLAQKIIGRACGVDGVRPGTYCEPRTSTVGSQDTTGPLTRDELKELGCLRFGADLVLQSFCHTSAYPKPVDVETQGSLRRFFEERGGVVLRPGDGILHPWLNRMLVPDQVGTGADSHTRFPLGLSFPAGSGRVAFAAAFGKLPLEVPESVLVRFSGELRPGVTLRDAVHAIPYTARRLGHVRLEKSDPHNVFSGRLLEIEGLPWLTVEQAFEFTDASAERSAAGCAIQLEVEPVAEFLRANVALLRRLIAEGYRDATALERRAAAMEDWLAAPRLLRADPDARYAAVIEIDLSTLGEPLLACPDDPDDVRPLSELAGTPIDEVFLGSCMTHIEHFRSAARLLELHGGPVPALLWIAPPTELDRQRLLQEGEYSHFAAAGARIEPPGCSLCMGNQARVAAGSMVVSTSTRNFPGRMGDGARVFLASAELAGVVAGLARLPTPQEYRARLEQARAGESDLLQTRLSASME